MEKVRWIIVAIAMILLISLPALAEAEEESYQLVVIGVEPEGIAAAVSAARQGTETLLIEGREGFGGTLIAAQLNSLDMNYGPQGELLTRGIFQDFFQEMDADSIDLDKAEKYFRGLIEAEELITFIRASDWEVNVLDGRLKSVVFPDGDGERVIKGDYFIDATGDGWLAAGAGVPYQVGKEDLGYERQMAVTLVFEVEGVDWQQVMNLLRGDGNPDSGANQRSAWGFAEYVQGYQAEDPKIMLRGLNMGRQLDGSVLINGLLIYDVDGLDFESRQEGRERGKREIQHVVSYLQEEVPGFQKASLAGYAPRLYIRESRYIEGLYTLNINDVLGNKIFWDRMALGSYPVDLHPTSPGHWGAILGVPDVYSIPLRSMVPVNIKNLLVVGRCASFSSLAAGSARVIPIGMAMGESAGIAASYCLENQLDFHQLSDSRDDVEELQQRIEEAGGYLREYETEDPYAHHWVYPDLKVIRESGYLVAGYRNQLHLEDGMRAAAFLNLLNNSLYSLTREVKELSGHPFSLPPGEEPMPVDEALKYILEGYQLFNTLDLTAEEGLQEELLAAGILSPELAERLEERETINRALGIALAADLVRAIRGEERGE